MGDSDQERKLAGPSAEYSKEAEELEAPAKLYDLDDMDDLEDLEVCNKTFMSSLLIKGFRILKRSSAPTSVC